MRGFPICACFRNPRIRSWSNRSWAARIQKGSSCSQSPSQSVADADGAFAQAQAAEEAGDVSTAEILYRRVMKLDPNDPAAGLNLGNLLRVQQRMVEAEAAYRWAVKVDPKFRSGLAQSGRFA